MFYNRISSVFISSFVRLKGSVCRVSCLLFISMIRLVLIRLLFRVVRVMLWLVMFGLSLFCVVWVRDRVIVLMLVRLESNVIV